jgi:hypothetical protein
MKRVESGTDFSLWSYCRGGKWKKNALAGREEPSDSTSTGRRQRELILTRENSIQCHPSAN